jgi:probable rRNA maturation factor
MPIFEKDNLTVIRKRGNLPPLPYDAIKQEILGKSYTLTVIFCTKEESRERNRIYRDKDYPTNILSFPLEKKEGEIYISLSTARKDAKKFDLSYEGFLHLLFVHGCLHLKGHDHGSTMEMLEQKYFKKFFRDSK